MENRSHALIAGAFTVLLIVATILGALWLGRDEVLHDRYEIVTDLAVTGLNPQAVVRYKGVKVGNVTDIAFDKQRPGKIVLQLDLSPDTPITQGTYATLGFQGVTGISFLQLDDNGNAPQPLVASSDGVPQIPLRPGLLQQLEQRGTALLQQSEEVARRLNGLLSDEHQAQLFSAVKQVQSTAAEAQQNLQLLQPTLKQLPQLGAQAQQSLSAVQKTADDARQLAQSVHRLSESLQDKQGVIQRVSGQFDQLSATLQQQTLPNFDALGFDAHNSLYRFDRLLDNLNDNPQSLLFGSPAPQPGPGEPGYSPSGKQP